MPSQERIGYRVTPYRIAEVHVFDELGRQILFNVEDSSVHLLDSFETEILSSCKKQGIKEAIKSFLKIYPLEKVAGAIDKLENNGILLSEEPKAPTYQPISNRVALTLNVTQSCNLRCRYCYVDKPLADSEPVLMSQEVAKKAVDFALNESCYPEGIGISFYGGEPLLNFPVIKSTILYANQKAESLGMPEIEFHMATNGTLLNEDMIDLITKYKINVLFSIDGTPSVHDTMRIFPDGRGTHAIVLKNLKRLLSIKGEHQVSASAVVTNINRLKTAYEYLSQFDLRDIKISFVRYIEGCDFALSAADSREYMKDMREIAKDCADKILSGTRPSYYEFETKMLQLWKRTKRQYFCPAGIKRFGVAPNGDIYPCGPAAAMKKYKIGDVFTGLYKEKQGQLIQRISIENRTECQKCWARYLCAGGCFLPLVRECDKKCAMRLLSTELAIAIFAIVKEKTELLLASLVDERFLSNVEKLISSIPSEDLQKSEEHIGS